MADKVVNNDNGALVESAMNQAIMAEQQAAEAVTATRRMAEEILLEARRKAGAIAARTDHRIAIIQKSRAKALKKRLDSMKLQQQRSAAFQISITDDSAALNKAVQELAARLIGAPSNLTAGS
ncbi:MAG: hypothetical protein H7839_08660 [Magnetococcus sp. YQC-5]